MEGKVSWIATFVVEESDVFIYLFLILYILSALGVGYLARESRAGWFGVFVLSLLITPLISFILVVGLSRSAARRKLS